MKIDVYFLEKKSGRFILAGKKLTTINPIAAEAEYFNLCKFKKNINGKIIVKSYNTVTLDAEYITGDCQLARREQNKKRHGMIWGKGQEWTKPCPLQMRGLAMARCGSQRGYQTRFAELLHVDTRTWRNWAKLINNQKQIPWYAWYAALSLFMNAW